jgi:hypothetical protein
VATSLSATSLTVKRGSTASITVTDTALNFPGTVSFAASGNPPFVSYTCSPASVLGSGSTTLTISPTTAASANNTFTLQVRTTAGGTVTQTPLTVTIQ